MSLDEQIKIVRDNTFDEWHVTIPSDDQSQQNYFTVRIKDEPDEMYDDEEDDGLQSHQDESISIEAGDDEANPDDEIEIKTEITVEETQIEKCSEFEMKRRKRLNFRCPLCDFRCNIRRTLRSHAKAAHPGKDVTPCLLCSATFEEASQLKKHTEEKHNKANKPEVVCKFCDFTCGSKVLLLAHVRETHPDVGSFKCGICRSTFNGTPQLEKHIAEAHQGLGQQCTICLTQYRKGHDHKSECLGRQLFSCDHCKIYYLRKEGLWKHLDLHEVQDDLKDSSISETFVKKQFFSCEICGDDRAYEKDRVRQHAKERHGGHYWLCPDCGKSFNTTGNRKSHMKKYCKVGLAQDRFKTEELECPECSKSVRNRAALEDHMAKYHRKNPYQCPKCDMKLPNTNELRKHKVKMHMEHTFSCSYCSMKFKLKCSLKKHMKTHKQQIANEPQSICNEKETGGTVQKNHEITMEEAEFQNDKTNKQSIFCKFCEYSCGSKTYLLVHTREAHPDVGSFACSICRVMFNGKSKLDQHITEAHQGLGQKCSICLTQYRKGQEHKSKCLGRQLFSCALCNMSFLRKEGLWKHLDEHDVQEDLKESSINETFIKKQFFSCEICGDDRAFEKEPLGEHATERHSGHYLICPDCGKTFNDGCNRRVHMRKRCQIGPARERFKLEKLECSECSKAIKSRVALEDHMVKYHRKNPYQCTECEMICSNAIVLQQHKITMHMEPSITCSYCSKKFKLNRDLKRHMTSHKNEKQAK